jgi:S1-C subfamily serine protease
MAVAGFFFAFSRETMVRQSDFVTSEPVRVQESSSDDVEAQRAIPTFTPAPAETVPTVGEVPQPLAADANSLSGLYERLNPGVVNVQILVDDGNFGGQGVGSGFILDEAGHIVTNNHVVARATRVTVVFSNGIEVNAEVIGTDPDSDLAVIKVEQLAEGAHPLALGDSDQVQVGQWVVAIGNPFSLGGSMSIGIVSALGRTIPSGATLFSIPQAIQTDAAINPGNSGGPLLNLAGEVIGVNAQIASQGTPANAGVGFAIPSNVVRRVAPVLIEQGHYEWPWLGVRGTSVNLALMDANSLDQQRGAYIVEVIDGGPASKAGLRGTSGSRQVDGLSVPTGGDIIIEADGVSLVDYNDLLTRIAAKSPGDTIDLTVLRGGQPRQITVTLERRPNGSDS